MSDSIQSIYQRPVLVITGPTAAGKTALALHLYDYLTAQGQAVQLINMDAAQIYVDMDIGTAKLSPVEQIRYPHALLDFLSPEQNYSVANFVADVTPLIAQAQAHNVLPILVGGTMMYFNALLHGLAPLPTGDSALREQLQQQLDSETGRADLYAELQKIDRQTAARIHPQDSQRLLRFIELYRLTGETPSQLWQAQTYHCPWRFFHVAILPSDRPLLHRRIEQRFDAMLADGFIVEVERLCQRYNLSPCNQSIRTVGYRQVHQYLNGELNRNEMREKAIIATRQLAKRQITWLRKIPIQLALDSGESVDLHSLAEPILADS